jgi:hypothetical protein
VKCEPKTIWAASTTRKQTVRSFHNKWTVFFFLVVEDTSDFLVQIAKSRTGSLSPPLSRNTKGEAKKANKAMYCWGT